MRFLAVAVLMFVSPILIAGSEKARFVLAYKGYKSKGLKEFGEVTKSSIVQCATYCIQEDNCYGFTMNASKICRLLKGWIDSSECPGDSCLKIEGFAVYVVASR